MDRLHLRLSKLALIYKIFNKTAPKIAPPAYRGLNSYDPRISQEYVEILLKQIDYHKIDKKVMELQEVAEKGEWTPTPTIKSINY